MTARSRIRLPRAATASLTAQQVARAYNYPAGVTGKGCTVGIIELGGALNTGDLSTINDPGRVTVVPVDGATPTPDPQGADAEVMLDVEVVGQVAPGAHINVYFAPNTDQGFLDAIVQAAAECNVVSISWGAAEAEWDAATMTRFDQAFAAARARGVAVLAAAGDSGSSDSEPSGAHVDFPASSPNVVGCGGTRLSLNSDGSRAAEVTWDDSARTSATGGGQSVQFPGRDVPDVAGDADPQSGYQILVNGQRMVVGGTSAVAPLYAGLLALLFEATGKVVDLLTVVPANPTVCYDVTVGNNGAFRAGPGRDEVTGYGVVDGGKLLAALGSGPVQPPQPPVTGTSFTLNPAGLAAVQAFVKSPHTYRLDTAAAAALKAAGV